MRGEACGAGLHLQAGLLAEDLEAFAPERFRLDVGRSLRQREDCWQSELNQALALVPPRPGDEAQVIVLDPPCVALVGKRTDPAVRDGLGIRRESRRSDELLESTSDAPMECRVAAQVDRRNRPVAQHDVGVCRLDALDLPHESVVEAELMDYRRLQASCELGVEHLVGKLAKGRRARHLAEEICAPLPETVKELRLVDQRGTVTHRLDGQLCGRFESLARVCAAIGG